MTWRDETPRPEPRGLRQKAGCARPNRRFRKIRRNTETRTEGIATGTYPRSTASHREDTTKHRDPNRGDCDSATSLFSQKPNVFSTDETPRPEPRGLRQQNPTVWSPPELANVGRNTETRTEGIATRRQDPCGRCIHRWVGETPRPEPRGLRPTSSRKSLRTTLFSALTKHRDPNRGDCDFNV